MSIGRSVGRSVRPSVRPVPKMRNYVEKRSSLISLGQSPCPIVHASIQCPCISMSSVHQCHVCPSHVLASVCRQYIRASHVRPSVRPLSVRKYVVNPSVRVLSICQQSVKKTLPLPSLYGLPPAWRLSECYPQNSTQSVLFCLLN